MTCTQAIEITHERLHWEVWTRNFHIDLLGLFA